MKETRAWLTVQVAAAAAVVVLVISVSEVTAKPTTDTRHAAGNHVEDQFLDNALVDWLDNFGTYTFMVKQDLDSHAGDADEDAEDEEQEQEGGVAEEDEEEEEEDVAEEWSAPIAVSTGQRSLLNPHHDYLVTVESLVAEEGSIFMTLSKYENQTVCGVGGLSLEEEVQQVPRAGGNGLGVAQEREPGADQTTFIAFALQQEGNSSASDSGWIAVSQQYWWASGYLTGGSILSITFTPPECGCLALSTYFALPLGNLTLVVGPQAYPQELQTLLCVDPLATAPGQEFEEEGHEDGRREEQQQEGEGEEEEEEEHIDYLQPSALVASRNPGEEVTETEATVAPAVNPTVLIQRRKMSREEKKTAKKTRRQMKRQRIRQAGRRQARQGQQTGRKTTRRWSRKKNQRKRMRVWKKLNKRGKKGRRGKLGAKHHHHHEVNGTSPEDMRENDPHHHHHHHDSAHPTNVSVIQEERLVDILLRDLHAENSTSEGSAAGEEEGDAAMTTEEGEGEGEGEENQTPRQRRKNRRQRKKMMRKQRRKVYGPGVKFCCKQGVKHKKTLLELGNTSAASPGPCDASNDVVITFANHQFGIEEATCTTTFTTCCGRFTEEMWDSIKARKEARKSERKQRRKSRRQDRKQRRKQERRLRKGMRRQAHARHHDEQ